MFSREDVPSLSDPPTVEVVPPEGCVTKDQMVALVAKACPASDYQGRRVLLIIPDGTPTAPIGTMFQALFAQFGSVARKVM